MTPQHHTSYHDAAAEGAGEVWFSLCDDTPPVVWREAFPDDIAREVVSVEKPNGRLTNSDLELAAEVLAVGVALERMNSKHTPLGTLCDNTPTVSWVDSNGLTARTAMNGTTETQQQWVVNGDGRHDGNSLDGDGRQWTARQRLESNGQIDSTEAFKTSTRSNFHDNC